MVHQRRPNLHERTASRLALFIVGMYAAMLAAGMGDWIFGDPSQAKIMLETTLPPISPLVAVALGYYFFKEL